MTNQKTTRHSHRSFLSLVLFCLLVTAAHAGTSHFNGHGLAVAYPDKYQLSDELTKHGWKVQLKNGPNSFVFNIYSNPLIDGFDEMVIKSLKDGFGKQNRPVTDAHKESIRLPVGVNGGGGGPVDLDAVRYSHTVNVDEGNLRLEIRQTMFFFSRGEHGYMINFTRTNAPEGDLDTVLSSINLDP